MPESHTWPMQYLSLMVIPLCKDIIHKCPECSETLLIDKFCNIKLQESNVKNKNKNKINFSS